VTGAEIDMQHGVDATVSATMTFPGDLEASLRCSMLTECFDAALTLRGELGRLTIRNFIGPQMGCSFRVWIGEESRTEPTDGPTTYEAQLEHLVQVMRDGITPLTGGQDAIANLVLMDAIRATA